MKGLMIKDLRLLFNQKKTWIMYVLLCVMMGFSMQGAFMVGYTVMLCGALGISTISYDQAENGMPFLFTLPIDRQGYVREKYLLCLMMEAAGAVFGLTVCEIISLIKTGSPVSMDDIHSSLIVIPVMLCLISFMIPINLKYGAEKARLVMMISYGIVGAVVALVAVLVQDILPSAGHSFFVNGKNKKKKSLAGMGQNPVADCFGGNPVHEPGQDAHSAGISVYDRFSGKLLPEYGAPCHRPGKSSH